jgi:AraC family transcriptional regulator, regulatory protein of adaptative response / DNA-3-methyladenine glycosylase II
MTLSYNPQEFYKAHLARDVRFDGKFFVAVKTTQIYCRPVCPARKAKEAGYRPCLRCRPETAPGSPAWLGTSGIIQRAIRLMDSFALEDVSISELAEKLGIGERWLRELFQEQVGASPQAILISKKLDLARNLLDHSNLSITDIAFSSGFLSVRRFNDAFKNKFKQPPSACRGNFESTFCIHLHYRPPYAWADLLNFLKLRQISGLEHVENGSYQRLISRGDLRGWFKVTPVSDSPEHHKLKIEFKFNKNANILELVTRIKHIFDLDADPMMIEQGLSEDPELQKFLTHYPGLRIPGCWDGFELAVRAVLGQKISVKAAHTLLGRLVSLCGEVQDLDKNLPLEKYFPTPESILKADLSRLGLPESKVSTLKDLAQKVLNQELVLDGTADFDQTCRTLLSIKGIGPWTVEYIAMRALRNPNAFPESDLVLQKKIKQLHLNPKLWTPWRAYAAILLWNIKP